MGLKQVEDQGRLLGLGLNPPVHGGIPPQMEDGRRYRFGVYWRNQVRSRVHSWDLYVFSGATVTKLGAQNNRDVSSPSSEGQSLN